MIDDAMSKAALMQRIRELESQVDVLTRNEQITNVRALCMNAFASLMEMPEILLPDIYSQLVDIIADTLAPYAIVSAYLTIDDKSFYSKNFTKSPWSSCATVLANDTRKGLLCIYTDKVAYSEVFGYTTPRIEELSELFAALLGNVIARHMFYRTLVTGEQKQIINELAVSERRFRAIIAESPIGILYYDSNGIILDCNAKFLEIIGSSMDQMIGFDMPKRLQNMELLGALREVLNSGSSVYKGWYASVTANKRTYVKIQFKAIYSNNEIVAGIGLVEDITERKLAKQALIESEERYRVLFENSNTLISVISRDGICKIANRKVGEALRQTPESLIGKSFIDFHPGDSKEFISRIQNCIDNNEAIDYVDEVHFPTGKRWVFSRLHPIAYGNDKQKHAQLISYDITEQKLAEDELRQSEARFKEIFHSVKEGIIYVDKSGKVLYANKALSDMTDIPIDELIGKNAIFLAKKFVTVRHLPGLLSKVARALSGNSLMSFELPYKDKVLEISTNYDSSSGRITSSFRDVTMQKQARKLLTESERKYRNLFENAPVGVFQSSASGKFLLVNETMSRILGFESPDTAISYYSDIQRQLYLKPERRTDFVELLRKHGFVENFEFEAYKFSGKTIWFSMNARMIGKKRSPDFVIEGFVTDITQRKKVEEALKAQTNLFETMFNSITDGIVITNTRREIILANTGMLKTFGYKPDEIIGKNTRMLYADTEAFDETGHDVFDKTASHGAEFYMSRYLHKNGNMFPGETFGSKLFDTAGNWIGNVGVMRDISERQNFIKQLEDAKDRAEHSDRLKSVFLANMSHEIRTPMNGIIGFSQMLMRPSLTKQKMEYYSQIIVDNSKQLLTIVNDILDISLIEAGQMNLAMEHVDVNRLLDSLYSLFEPQVKLLQIDFNISKDDSDVNSVIYTDATRLRQILSNLLNNALKFTKQGSIEFGYKIENDFLKFYVFDTGVGIASELLEEVFERFRQEELEDSRKMGGTGLGLSISKKLVEMLGGRIWVESTKGKGAKFFFTIPREQ